jgi:hypothetical protein
MGVAPRASRTTTRPVSERCSRCAPHGVVRVLGRRLRARACLPAPPQSIPLCLCPCTAPQRMLLFHRSLYCIGLTCSAPFWRGLPCLVRYVMLVVTMACIVQCLSPLPPSVVSAGTCVRHVHPQQAPLQHWHHWTRGPWQDHSDGSPDQGLCMSSLGHSLLQLGSHLGVRFAPLISHSAALARTPFIHTDVHCLCWGRGCVLGGGGGARGPSALHDDTLSPTC